MTLDCLPTWGLVTVTHCRRSLLIRYSKASSSFTSDFPAAGPEEPLGTATWEDTDRAGDPNLVAAQHLQQAAGGTGRGLSWQPRKGQAQPLANLLRMQPGGALPKR